MAKSFPNTGATVGLAADRTAMTSMLEGQEFFETDTNKMFVYSGSAWVETNSWSTTSGVTGVNNLIVPPSVRVYRTGDLTYTINTSIAWNAESYDTDTMHNNTTNSERLTITTPGLYLVVFSSYITYSGTMTAFDYSIYKNGTSGTRIAGDYASVVAYTGGLVKILTTVSEMGNGDYFTAVLNTASSSSHLVKDSSLTHFTATWIGRTS